MVFYIIAHLSGNFNLKIIPFLSKYAKGPRGYSPGALLGDSVNPVLRTFYRYSLPSVPQL